MAFRRPVVSMGRRRVEVDVAHLAFVVFIATFTVWFLCNAWTSAPDLENMILILPVSVLTLALIPFVAAHCFRAVAPGLPRSEAEAAELRPPLAPGVAPRIAGSMVLLVAVAVAGPLIGFDVATIVYVAVMMALLGERRVWMLVLVPLIFAALVIYVFDVLLATPLPLLLFHGAG